MTAPNEPRLAVVVVGASRGIGKAIAKVAARDKVPLFSRLDPMTIWSPLRKTFAMLAAKL